MKLPKYIEQALENLTGSGFDAFVVGGCVRDMIMGKTPADYTVETDPQIRAAIDAFNR